MRNLMLQHSRMNDNGNEKTKKYIIQDLLKLRLFGDISENDQRSLRALRSSVI